MNRLVLLFSTLAVSNIRAEERTFSVTLDGKPAGEVVLSFVTRDESTTVSCKTTPDPKIGCPVAYRGSETWKAGRLVRLDTASKNDRPDGLTLLAGKEGYTLKAGVKDVTVRGEVWPDTFAMFPAADRPLIVNTVTGEVTRAKIEKVGADRVTVVGKAIPATRYRVTAGGIKTDMWFDEQNRLVRRAWTRDGRAISMDLTKLHND